MLESKMQAWKELQYVNCYRLNSENRNGMTVGVPELYMGLHPALFLKKTTNNRTIICHTHINTLVTCFSHLDS